MGLRRWLFVIGSLCFLAAVLLGAGLFGTPTANAAGTWTSERIYNDAIKEIGSLHAQGDYVVWTTYSRADGEDVDVYLYKVSTKQTTRIAGPGLAYQVDDEALVDGTHVVWSEATSDGGSDVILYDIAAAKWTRLSAGAPDTDEFEYSLQGDWLVWHGLVAPGPGDWTYDPTVFAYRISTSGPIQSIHWRDHETSQYPEGYRSMDEYPFVSNAKMAWMFERPDGGNYLGVLNLASGVVDWQWRVPAGQAAGPGYGQTDFIWNDYVLFALRISDGQTFRFSLMLRSPGMATPEAIVENAQSNMTGLSIRGGVAVWCAGDVYYKKPGSSVTKVANTSSVMTLSSDGSHLAWNRQGGVWWLDLNGGTPEQIPGAGGSPSVVGTHVAWDGDYKSGGGYHSVYVSSRGGSTFSDVPSGHPYAAAIAGMASRGIIGGFDDGTFGPDKPVTRQQFAKMIVLTLDLPVAESDFPSPAVPFVDLGADDTSKLYPHEYVAVCALNNITKGTDATHFAPTANIKRAQMVTMVVRAADNLAAGSLNAAPGDWSGQLPYADPTHGANIKKAEYNGLLAGIVGSGGTLASWNTDGNATRGEVAQMLWNLLGKLN